MTIAAGQVVTADDLNELGPLDSIKPADQHYTTTTLTNDTDLVVAVQPNTSYLVQVFVLYEGGTSGAADMKVQFAVPSGATLRLTNIGQNASGTATGSFAVTASTVTTGNTNGAGNLRTLTFNGSLVTGSSGGNFQLQAAQNSSNATDTIIHAQSSMWLQEGS